ncbi:surfeit locus 1 family protein [Sphingobium fontiphilum]|uniref:SURF1-like protein n=1 Tax=Sphingobium fontiphilum TaxID=944425 RepID=A0A7W6GQI2_9SPHN|nr:SURF1 family protein [Sphingobium fontiphilum]MBB3982069.1 surfeit locus 1 family protein [Sphingobium fontiphilum]
MTPAPPAGGRRFGPIILLFALALGFVALGVWQVRRLAWKEALIARVDAGTKAPPVDAAAIPPASARALEYRAVQLRGVYDPAGLALVAGASDLGSGYWVLAPLRLADGRLVYVNRGFLPVGSKADEARRALPTGPVSVTGLLRLSEPGGAWLRANRPAEGRWYSRDIAAIAAQGRVRAQHGFFVDAREESPRSANAPVPGLTVIRFANNHLVYALTWFALALLSVGAMVVLWRKGP